MLAESHPSLLHGEHAVAGRLTQFVGASAQSVALASGVSSWLARRQLSRRILMLHGVGGPKLPVADFKRAMVWLAQNFRIVPLDAMVNDIAIAKPVARDAELAITFDDGLRNQGRLAYPILQALGIPAAIFLCPGLIDNKQWQWNHEARARLNRLSPAQRNEWARAQQAPSAHIEALIAWLKQQPLQPRLRIEASLRDATPGFAPTAEEHAAYDPMDWDEVAALDPRLITIGSHTVTHPILSTLDEAGIQQELQASRLMLEARLARPVELFCYPNGSHDERVRRIATQVYRAAVTTEEGLVTEPVDIYAMPRIPVAAQLPLLAWRMHRPWA
ncbi:polysaccharide deacetylase family protein [Thiomonas sp.]